MVKEAIIFAGGLAVGVAAGVLLSKKHYSMVARDNIEAIKENYERQVEAAKAPRIFRSEQEDMKATVDLGKEKTVDTGTEMEKLLAKKYADKVISYNGYSAEKSPEEKTEKAEEVTPTIHQITYKDYTDPNANYERIDVTWYPDPASDAGGLLVEDLTDKPISIADTIGEPDRTKEPGEEYYVRNEDIKVDFIVTVGDHPYT